MTTTRRATAILLSALVALAALAAAPAPVGAETCPPASGSPFLDIPESHPFCREIKQAQTEGFVTGYGDGTFRPANVVTRQAAAAILWRIANYGGPGAPFACGVSAYPDVPADHPFCGHIRDSTAAGVFTGYGDGTFRPANPMTRLAMAMVIARFPDGPKIMLACGAPPFTDVPVSHPQCAQIQYAKNLGILTGYADGTFRPGNPMTRQAFAAVAIRTWGALIT